MKGDNLSQTSSEKIIEDRVYTKLVEIDQGKTFELEKNKTFVEKILGTKLNNFKFELPRKKLTNHITQKYIILFTGASASFRQWPIDKFLSLSKFLIQKYSFYIIYCGGSEDFKSVETIISDLPVESCLNLCGKETLYDFLTIVEGCELLVSNETSAVHIGVGLHKKTVCISNGNHYGRFNPYENYGFQNVKTVYPDSILCMPEEKRLELYAYGSTIDISTISLESVISSIEALMDD